jgi:hypothetical protein
MPATVKRDGTRVVTCRAKVKAKAIGKAPAAKAKAKAAASANASSAMPAGKTLAAQPAREAPTQAGTVIRSVSSEHMTALGRALMPIHPSVRANAVIRVLAWIEEREL